jgi:hypothetical protein
MGLSCLIFDEARRNDIYMQDEVDTAQACYEQKNVSKGQRREDEWV